MFSFSLASFWSYMSAALGYVSNHDSLDVAMGCVLLLCQIIGAIVSIIVSLILFAPSKHEGDSTKDQLSFYIEPTILFKNARMFSAISLLSLTNPSLLIFLPWVSSDFSVRSSGYPNLGCFRLMVYLQCILSSVRCAALLIAQQSTSSTFASLIFSIGMLVLTLSEAAIKLKAENIQQYDSAVVSRATLAAMKKNSLDMAAETGDVEMQDAIKEDVKMQQEIEKLKAEIETLRQTNRESFNVDQAPDLDDVEALHLAKIKYADENVDILKDQLNEVGMNPLEYIPLPKIEAELAQLTKRVNNGESFDEKRLDHLLACMERNPQYRATVEEKRHKERETLAPLLVEHLNTMRGFVPPTIFSTTQSELQEEGYSKVLAKRLLTKRCLWLVRMTTQDIMRLHEVDLTGKYGFGGQTLDLVEKTALLAVMPARFDNDGRGMKKKYLRELEDSVKQMHQQAEAHRLTRNLLRNVAYTDQVGRFQENTEMYIPDVTSSEDAFGPRDSFRSSSGSSLSNSLSLSLSRNKDISSSVEDDVLASRSSSSSSSSSSGATLNPLHVSDKDRSRYSRSSSGGSTGVSATAIGPSEMKSRTSVIDNLFKSQSRGQSRPSSTSRHDSGGSGGSSSEDSNRGIGQTEMQKRSAAIGNLFK